MTDDDRIEEIAMAIGCDMPEANPYPPGTVESAIYELRRRAEKAEALAKQLKEALERSIGHYSRRSFLLRRLYEILPHPLAWINEKMDIVHKVEKALEEKRPPCIGAAISAAERSGL